MKKISILIAALLAVCTVFAGCDAPEVKTHDAVAVGNGAPAGTVTPSLDTSGEQDPGGSDVIPEDKPYVPDILDPDPDITIGGDYDFSATYDYTGAVEAMTCRAGTATVTDGSYLMTRDGTLYANTDTTVAFPHGTIEADVMSNGADAGVIFGVTTPTNSFWEGPGIRYYFYFVSMAGHAYLGSADNGSWKALSSVAISGFNKSTTYHIKAIFKGNKILCYLDGKLMFTHTDNDPSTGTGWGIRCNNGSNARISNISLTSEFIM